MRKHQDEEEREPTPEERIGEVEQRVFQLEQALRALAEHEHGVDGRVNVPFLAQE